MAPPVPVFAVATSPLGKAASLQQAVSAALSASVPLATGVPQMCPPERKVTSAVPGVPHTSSTGCEGKSSAVDPPLVMLGNKPAKPQEVPVTDRSTMGTCGSAEDQVVNEAWVQLSDEGGKAYFWNRRTNSCTWYLPKGITAKWIGGKSPDGRDYYWSRTSTEVCWVLPALTATDKGASTSFNAEASEKEEVLNVADGNINPAVTCSTAMSDSNSVSEFAVATKGKQVETQHCDSSSNVEAKVEMDANTANMEWAFATARKIKELGLDSDASTSADADARPSSPDTSDTEPPSPAASASAAEPASDTEPPSPEAAQRSSPCLLKEGDAHGDTSAAELSNGVPVASKHKTAKSVARPDSDTDSSDSDSEGADQAAAAIRKPSCANNAAPSDGLCGYGAPAKETAGNDTGRFDGSSSSSDSETDSEAVSTGASAASQLREDSILPKSDTDGETVSGGASAANQLQEDSSLPKYDAHVWEEQAKLQAEEQSKLQAEVASLKRELAESKAVARAATLKSELSAKAARVATGNACDSAVFWREKDDIVGKPSGTSRDRQSRSPGRRSGAWPEVFGSKQVCAQQQETTLKMSEPEAVEIAGFKKVELNGRYTLRREVILQDHPTYWLESGHFFAYWQGALKKWALCPSARFKDVLQGNGLGWAMQVNAANHFSQSCMWTEHNGTCWTESFISVRGTSTSAQQQIDATAAASMSTSQNSSIAPTPTAASLSNKAARLDWATAAAEKWVAGALDKGTAPEPASSVSRSKAETSLRGPVISGRRSRSPPKAKARNVFAITCGPSLSVTEKKNSARRVNRSASEKSNMGSTQDRSRSRSPMSSSISVGAKKSANAERKPVILRSKAEMEERTTALQAPAPRPSETTLTKFLTTVKHGAPPGTGIPAETANSKPTDGKRPKPESDEKDVDGTMPCTLRRTLACGGA
eukprot:gnl/TRDRNA2_/TRDRNA2_156808_c1_seq27.p1 gnl/TRDRNA2_/TRDRNA2_156808_c1~~gnl/TRDRNA2_/TRDRNA2_156808_c1_seq27.p1  ORF type:complete len:952 (+),score=151.67 gnl/TRDRNA2_/TRDRNA2_156808_c1_seq27:52-2856(+)